MIFRELSNAVFRFVLRCAGAEIDGGGGVFKHPPAGGGKSRGPAWRGLKQLERLLFSFVWGGKRDPIKRARLVQDFSSGGLRMVNL